MLRLTIGVTTIFVTTLAFAQSTYPTKPVRIILPFAPGANADLIGRIVAQRVSPMWGQPVLQIGRAHV